MLVGSRHVRRIDSPETSVALLNFVKFGRVNLVLELGDVGLEQLYESLEFLGSLSDSSFLLEDAVDEFRVFVVNTEFGSNFNYRSIRANDSLNQFFALLVSDPVVTPSTLPGDLSCSILDGIRLFNFFDHV